MEKIGLFIVSIMFVIALLFLSEMVVETRSYQQLSIQLVDQYIKLQELAPVNERCKKIVMACNAHYIRTRQ